MWSQPLPAYEPGSAVAGELPPDVKVRVDRAAARWGLTPDVALDLIVTRILHGPAAVTQLTVGDAVVRFLDNYGF